MFDLRLPSGIFFALIGLLLVAMGLTVDTRAAMTTANVNLYAGGFIFAFGCFLLLLAKGRKRK